MSEWREFTLGKLIDDGIADLQTGPFGTMLKASEYSDVGTPVIAVQDIGENRLIHNKFVYVEQNIVTRLSRYKVKEGDIIFGRKGAVERRARIRKEEDGWLQGSDCIRLRFNSRINSIFISYQFGSKSYREWMIQNSTGATMPSLNQSVLKLLPIRLPPIEEQKAIADILSSFDDKIDLLHRQNKTLESMAETLFRQWFAEGENESCSVNDLIEFNPTRKLTKGTMAPYLEMAALSTTTFNPESWYSREFSSGTKFINGDTLLARITPCLENGKTAYVTFLQEGEVAWGSTEYIVMRPKEGLHPFFAYALARNSDFRDYAEGCMEGSSGRQRINVDHLKDYELAIPSKEALQQFNDCAASITPKLHANFVQLKTLEKLRDCLLPKLMNGEIRVADYKNNNCMNILNK